MLWHNICHAAAPQWLNTLELRICAQCNVRLYTLAEIAEIHSIVANHVLAAIDALHYAAALGALLPAFLLGKLQQFCTGAHNSVWLRHRQGQASRRSVHLAVVNMDVRERVARVTPSWLCM
jgi:hypothetical protein